MLGAIFIAIVLLVLFPVIFWTGIGAVSAALSVVLTDHAEDTHKGSELIETNV